MLLLGLLVAGAPQAHAADVIALPRVSAKTSTATDRGRRVLRVRSVLVRNLHGTLRVSCNRCRRLTGARTRVTRPSSTSKRFTGVNWLLGAGRVIRVTVVRRGWVGRFLILSARTRGSRRGLVFSSSGCLDSRRKRVRCPRGVPQPSAGSTVPAAPVRLRVATPGIVHAGQWFLSAAAGGAPNRIFGFGNPGDVPVLGDWNGDGIDTPGTVRDGRWLLSDTFGGPATRMFNYGDPGDIFLVGDWNGDGIDTPGAVRGSRWLLADTFGVPIPHDFYYGNPGDSFVVGDWNGDGIDTPGAVRAGRWLLSNRFGVPIPHDFYYGDPGDIPVAGDWNGDGIDTPGAVRGGQWFLTDTFGLPITRDFTYGNPGDVPVVGSTSPP